MELPKDVVWFTMLQQFLDVNEIAQLNRVHRFFGTYWIEVYPLHQPIPVAVSRFHQSMKLAVVLTKKRTYTQENPIVLVLSVGVHVIGDSFDVPCSNMTLMGKGHDQTTIRGGLGVINQTNVVLKDFNVTNPGGDGLWMNGSETNVKVVECTVQQCQENGMCVSGGATTVATRCEFMKNDQFGVYVMSPNTKVAMHDCTSHHNGFHGLFAHSYAVVNLHGEATDIHNNQTFGIVAAGKGKVNIHLPSQHNTSHDNGKEDRNENGGGTITNNI